MRAAVIVFITHKGCVDCDEWCSGWDFKILAGLLGVSKDYFESFYSILELFINDHSLLFRW